jgi:hypothetical protein
LTRTCREQQFARMILIVLSIHQSKRALPTQMQRNERQMPSQLALAAL